MQLQCISVQMTSASAHETGVICVVTLQKELRTRVMARGSWFSRHTAQRRAPAERAGRIMEQMPAVQRNLVHPRRGAQSEGLPEMRPSPQTARQRAAGIAGGRGQFRGVRRALDVARPARFPRLSPTRSNAPATKTGLTDAILTGHARIEDKSLVILGVADFAFMGGSMGSVVGEKIVRAMERGARSACPSSWSRPTAAARGCRRAFSR